MIDWGQTQCALPSCALYTGSRYSCQQHLMGGAIGKDFLAGHLDFPIAAKLYSGQDARRNPSRNTLQESPTSTPPTRRPPTGLINASLAIVAVSVLVQRCRRFQESKAVRGVSLAMGPKRTARALIGKNWLRRSLTKFVSLRRAQPQLFSHADPLNFASRALGSTRRLYLAL